MSPAFEGGRSVGVFERGAVGLSVSVIESASHFLTNEERRPAGRDHRSPEEPVQVKSALELILDFFDALQHARLNALRQRRVVQTFGHLLTVRDGPV